MYVKVTDGAKTMLVDRHGSAQVLLYGADGTPFLTANSPGSMRVVNTSDEAVPTQLTSSYATMRTPVVGVKTVTATAAEIFAGSSRRAGRSKMVLKNEDGILRFRIGPSTVTQQNGFPVEPGAVVELDFDPFVDVPIYVISEGSSLQVAVMEI